VRSRKPTTSGGGHTISEKRAYAYEVARDLFNTGSVELILLTGSVARGIASDDSDVDLALFTRGKREPFILTRQIRGTQVESNIYNINRVAHGPATPLLSLQELREAGRFATGELLFSRWEHFDQARASWLDALLYPEEVARLLALANTYLDPARRDSCHCSADLVWMLQGAASALATLALCLFPFRFQKPKWVIHDLREANLSLLLENVKMLYFGAALDAEGTGRVLRTVKQQLLAGLRLGRLPLLALNKTTSDRYFYLYRTFCDARSLRRDKDFAGSAYTATYAIRLLNAMLQDPSTLPAPVRKEEVDEWRRFAVEALISLKGLDGDALEKSRCELAQVGRELRQEYKRRFVKSQSFEVFPEGSWRSKD